MISFSSGSFTMRMNRSGRGSSAGSSLRYGRSGASECTSLDEVHSLAPDRPYLKELPAEEPLPERFILIVKDPDENEIIAYQPERRVERELPDPASEPKQPADIAS